MIVHLFDTARSDLEPDIINGKVWYMKVFTEKEEVELRISEDHGKLHVSVDSQLIIEPCASNTVSLSSRRF